ncbi:hypothetical protein A0J61_10051 [Choanephora cucurbitarum]|uniref:ATP-dependent DNA helicase n=1 Tax=Choanephora cucurbitarum TaxID=101091 RepID=A0A1C7MYI4_9FUNG|nr:hypothetical protein A0J61_10051 [Choanephora cucurbitarum]
MEAFKRDQIAGDIAPAHFGNNLFFFDSPGGTGRTYLFNALLHAIRRTDSVVLSVAVSGTADLLLKGGRTAHLKFKIPLDYEASMISRNVLETVDRSFKDIMKQKDERLADVPFGEKLIVFGGGFRQVLPVAPHSRSSPNNQHENVASYVFRRLKPSSNITKIFIFSTFNWQWFISSFAIYKFDSYS